MTEDVLKIEPTPPLPKPTSGWFGPLFFWEMLREGRKGSSYLPRVMYTSGLLFFLYLVMGHTEITQQRIGDLCEQSFNYYLLLQYLVIVLLTPAFVVGSIIEDRQQRTLSLLLTTHLTPREIVLGKLMGRLVPLLSILLAGVPILALLQLLGGISMSKLVFHSTLSLILLLIISMHSIRASTLYRSVGAGIFSVYATLIGIVFILSPITLMMMNQIIFHQAGLILWIAIIAFCNFFFAVVALYNAIRTLSSREKDLDLTLSEIERVEQKVYQPAILIGPAKIIRVANEESVEIVEANNRVVVTPQPRVIDTPPYLGDHPILWKETYHRSNDLLMLFTVLSYGLAATVFLVYVLDVSKKLKDAHEFFVNFTRVMLTVVLILAALRAAGTIVNERKKQTLLSVLMMPLSWNHMMIEYCLASFWRYRGLSLCALLTALLAYLTEPTTILMMAISFTTQLAFFTILGFACSTLSSSAFHARIILSAYLILSFLAFPWIKPWVGMSFLYCFDLMSLPSRIWLIHNLEHEPGQPVFLATSTLLLNVFILVNLMIVWGLTYLLFRFSRYRLNCWLEQGGG